MKVPMKKLVCAAAMSALVAAFASGQAQAATFTEANDAGETLETAQTIQGSLPLESISGILSEETPDADLFKIALTGGQTFSATTVGGADFDTQLFLFNQAGQGVYGNDNASPMLGSNQSTLPQGGFSPVNSGIYYLAISGFDYDPVDADGNEIYPDPASPFNQVFGPDSNSSLSEFDGTRLNGGSYTISLTGAQAVPEPSSALSTLAIGVLGTGFWLKQRKRKWL